MSRIDELQRLHEAATVRQAQLRLVCSDETRESIVALHNAWPAIHRVLVAARACQGGGANDLAELADALRALDGGA